MKTVSEKDKAVSGSVSEPVSEKDKAVSGSVSEPVSESGTQARSIPLTGSPAHPLTISKAYRLTGSPAHVPLSEGALLARLRERYRGPEFAFLSHVRNHTGYGKRERYADGLAMSLYPSRGIYLHGFEIKSSRSDWLNEKKDPDKADAIAKFCDFWWLVIGRDDIVREDELPAAWGLLVPAKDKLRSVKTATALEPLPLTRGFIAAVLRRAAEAEMPSDEFDEKVKQRIDETVRCQTGRLESEVERLTRNHDEFRRYVAAFEEKAGIRINMWNHGDIGEAVRLVLSGAFKLKVSDLRALERQARNITNSLTEALASPMLNDYVI